MLLSVSINAVIDCIRYHWSDSSSSGEYEQNNKHR